MKDIAYYREQIDKLDHIIKTSTDSKQIGNAWMGLEYYKRQIKWLKRNSIDVEALF